jgi:hypothetical protein
LDNINYDFYYFKNLADKQYNTALSNIQELIKYANKWSDNNKQLAEKTNQFIYWCLNEHQSESLKLYTFTRQVIYNKNPITFLENLYSFVGNCIYDDFSFIIEYHDYPDKYYQTESIRERINDFPNKSCIRKTNGIFNYDNKTMHNWEPVLLSVGDENPNSTQNPDYILSAIKFIEDQEKWRVDWEEKRRCDKFEQ